MEPVGTYGGYTVYENKIHDKRKIDSIFYDVYNVGENIKVYGSDSAAGPFTKIVDSSPGSDTTFSLTADQQYRFMYVVGVRDLRTYFRSTAFAAGKDIHADAAPAAGATITVSYRPKCIAKNANSIFKTISGYVTFGEYTP